MYVLKTRNKPRSALVKGADPDDSVVRVYKSSPQDLILQLWSGRRYMLVALFPAEARTVAKELLACADAVDAGSQESAA